MHKQSKQYQSKLVNTLTAVEQYKEVFYAEASAGNYIDENKQQGNVLGQAHDFLKDLQELTYLDPNKSEKLNSIYRILPTSQPINLINPTDEQLDLAAIIANLEGLVRFGGAAINTDGQYFTVAHHLMLGFWIINQHCLVEGKDEFVNIECCKYWLANDLQKGSMGIDMPQPYKIALNIKAGFDIWKEFEDDHAEKIHKKLGLQWPVPEADYNFVKAIDLICLVSEAKYLLNYDIQAQVGVPPIEPQLFNTIMNFINEGVEDSKSISLDLFSLMSLLFPDAFKHNLIDLETNINLKNKLIKAGFKVVDSD